MQTLDFEQRWERTTDAGAACTWKLGACEQLPLGPDDLRQNVLRPETSGLPNLRTPLLRELLNPAPGAADEQEVAKPTPSVKSLGIPAELLNDFAGPDASALAGFLWKR